MMICPHQRCHQMSTLLQNLNFSCFQNSGYFPQYNSGRADQAPLGQLEFEFIYFGFCHLVQAVGVLHMHTVDEEAEDTVNTPVHTSTLLE